MIKSHDFSVFNWGTVSLFSKVATLFYISSSSSWELQFLYILSSICYCHLFSSLFFFLILGTILRTVLKRLGRRILPCAWYLCMLSHFSHVWLCNPMNCSPSGSSVQGILQARILEWVAIPSSRWFSQPRDWTCISYLPCIGRQVLYH